MLGQVSVDPTSTPVVNDGGWVYNAAILLTLLAIAIALLIVFGYMRLAPRFQTDEQTRKAVRVPRMQPGAEVRRPVRVTGTPAVVQPPVVVVSTAAVAAPAAPAPAAVAAPATVPAAAAAATPAQAPAQAPAPAAQAAAAEPPGQAAEGPAGAQAAGEPASPAPATAAAPSGGDHKDVSLDQETFDRVLAELLDKGTDRRVAEGQARRAAMIAARKKAEG